MKRVSLSPANPSEQYLPRLPEVIGAIGEWRFGSRLLSHLHHAYGADHCAIFHLVNDAPHAVTASSLDGTGVAEERSVNYIQRELWRRDPTMTEARRIAHNDSYPVVIKLDVPNLADSELKNVVYREISDRLLLCGRCGSGTIALSMLRSSREGAFTSEATHTVKQSAALLLSILDKHLQTLVNKKRLATSLSSLSQIEDLIATASEHFPKREAQVAARIIYGVSSAGIASEFGISEETVMTYRKRIYARLGIGSQRELLNWYVVQCSSVDERPASLDLAH